MFVIYLLIIIGTEQAMDLKLYMSPESFASRYIKYINGNIFLTNQHTNLLNVSL